MCDNNRNNNRRSKNSIEQKLLNFVNCIFLKINIYSTTINFPIQFANPIFNLKKKETNYKLDSPQLPFYETREPKLTNTILLIKNPQRNGQTQKRNPKETIAEASNLKRKGWWMHAG